MATDTIDTRFLDALASAEPTPGGGSASAVAGAIAAGLLSMVGNLTVGRERFAAVEEEMASVLAETERLRTLLVKLAGEDMAAYGSFSAAMKMPRGSAGERAERTEHMQTALRACTLAPLRIAEACRRLLDFSPTVAEKGNPSAASDAVVAALLAEAAMRGAGLQVLVNLEWLKDADFIAEQRARLTELEKGAAELKEAVVAMVGGEAQG